MPPGLGSWWCPFRIECANSTRRLGPYSVLAEESRRRPGVTNLDQYRDL